MRLNVLTGIGRVVRGQDWWFYKIPPLLATGYAAMVICRSVSNMDLMELAATIAAICTVGAFGYVINDVFDVDSDRRSGKPNRMAGVGPVARTALCLSLPVLGFAVLRIARPTVVAQMLFWTNLLVPLLYSMPGIRLKERGVLGVLADATAAHLLPTALMVSTVARQCTSSGGRATLFISAVGWATCSGLRGILVHQVADSAGDARAGTRTFGGRLGAARARALTFRVIVPAEFLSLFVFLSVLVRQAFLFDVVLLVYAAGEMLKIGSSWRLPLFEDEAVSREPYIPVLNNELYEVWLPIGLALQLTLVRAEFILVLAFQILAFLPNTRRRLNVFVQLLDESPRAPRGLGGGGLKS